MIQSEPDYEAALGLIKHLSVDELKNLVNDEDKLMELLKDLPQIKNISEEKQILDESNKSFAEYNLAYQSKLEEGKQDLIMKYEEMNTLNEEIKSLKSQIESSSCKQSADTIQALLLTSADQKEEETEQMIQSFLNKEETVEAFVGLFVTERTIAHTRKVKAEKATELLRLGGNQPTYQPPQNYSLQSPPNQPGYPPPPPQNQWGQVPYPTQMPNMPMPRF